MDEKKDRNSFSCVIVYDTGVRKLLSAEVKSSCTSGRSRGTDENFILKVMEGVDRNEK